LAIGLGGRFPGYPTNYKVDLGNIETKLAIECDGHKHKSPKERLIDAKKGEKLASLGWTVLRFWNQQILEWIDTGMPMDSSISTIFKQHGIEVTALKGCSSTTAQCLTPI
jgi:hypothetical protein